MDYKRRPKFINFLQSINEKDLKSAFMNKDEVNFLNKMNIKKNTIIINNKLNVKKDINSKVSSKEKSENIQNIDKNLEFNVKRKKLDLIIKNDKFIIRKTKFFEKNTHFIKRSQKKFDFIKNDPNEKLKKATNFLFRELVKKKQKNIFQKINIEPVLKIIPPFKKRKFKDRSYNFCFNNHKIYKNKYNRGLYANSNLKGQLRYQPKRLNLFWTRKNLNYPFIFKKVFRSENINVEIYDISNKVILLKEKPCFNFGNFPF